MVLFLTRMLLIDTLGMRAYLASKNKGVPDCKVLKISPPISIY